MNWEAFWLLSQFLFFTEEAWGKKMGFLPVLPVDDVTLKSALILESTQWNVQSTSDQYVWSKAYEVLLFLSLILTRKGKDRIIR